MNIDTTHEEVNKTVERVIYNFGFSYQRRFCACYAQLFCPLRCGWLKIKHEQSEIDQYDDEDQDGIIS